MSEPSYIKHYKKCSFNKLRQRAINQLSISLFQNNYQLVQQFWLDQSLESVKTCRRRGKEG